MTTDRHPTRRLVRSATRWLAAFCLVAIASSLAPQAGATRAAGPSASPAIRHAAARDGAAGSVGSVGSVGSPTGVQPTIHYEDWLAHAADPNEFVPGDRVAVPFRPRAGDRFAVGGRAPRALPAGRASGREMAASRQGARWADVPGEPVPGAPALASGVDQPIVDPASVVAADGTAAAAPAPSDAALAPAATSGLRREVFGFLPYWEVGDSTTTLDYDLLSTIAYFGVGTDRYGNLLKQQSDGSLTTGWGGWTSSRLTSIIDAAHRKGTRVVLTVQMFAWSSSQATTQGRLLGSPSARLNLAKQAAAAVRDRGADGINLDFEPIASGYADEFTELVRTMRKELDAIAPGYQLTFDTTGWIGNYPIEDATAAGGADAIFIMGYDYRGSGSSPVGSIAPLDGPAYDIGDTLDAYLARVAASKLILGVPYYGRAWSTTTDGLNARNQSGEKYGYSAAVIYGTAVDYLAQYGRGWDSLEQVAWTAYQRQNCTSTYGCVTSWRELYVDDVQALAAKYDVVNRRGLRGVGIWALGYDGTRPELYRTLRQKFVEDTTPPLVGIRALPLVLRDEGFSVSWTAYDDSAIAGYDVQVAVDGGAWTGWLAGVTFVSDVYLGSSGHRYAFRVRARDVKGNQSAWDVTTTGGEPASMASGSFARVKASALSVRVAPDTSATKVGELGRGAAVLVTGGPVSADGYTWWQITGPLAEWGPVQETDAGVWMAGSSAAGEYLVPRQPLNVAIPDAGLRALTLAATGTTPGSAGARTISPNGDGKADRLRLQWQGTVALDDLSLGVFRPDGSLVGRIALGAQPVGSGTFDWDGRIGTTPVRDGTYLLQLLGHAGSATYAAPAAVAVAPSLIATQAVTIDRVVLRRLAGPDRYATAAAVSADTFKSGAPVAYVATGLNYPDALAGAVAAARSGGPLLLVTSDTLPAATAAELKRLAPTRIVVLGSTGVVSDKVAGAAKTAARGL